MQRPLESFEGVFQGRLSLILFFDGNLSVATLAIKRGEHRSFPKRIASIAHSREGIAVRDHDCVLWMKVDAKASITVWFRHK